MVPILSNPQAGSSPHDKVTRIRLLLVLGLAIVVTPSAHGSAEGASQATSGETSELRRLIEEQRQYIQDQDRRIRALDEKVRRLEEHAAPFSASNGAPPARLPAIVTDTNGVPVPSPVSTEAKLQALEARQLSDEKAAEERARHRPVLSVGSSGFAMSSADTNFLLKFRLILQADSRSFAHDNRLLGGNDTFLIRRARPILAGTVFRDAEFLVMPDFAGTSPQLFEAWLNYRFRPELQLRAGKVRGTVGLENLFLDSLLMFNERGLVTDLVPITSPGVELWGDVADGRVQYAAGLFNGAGDGRVAGNTDFSDDRTVGARLFLRPFRTGESRALRGIGFGLGATYSQVHSNAAALPSTTGGTLPGYFSTGQQQFFAYNPVLGTVVADGVQWRLAPQATYTLGPFGLLGEYAISHQRVLNNATFSRAGLDHTAWQVSGMWVLTGEEASFTGLTPSRAFDPLGGGWGAWQMVARFGRLGVDPDSFHGFANPLTSARSAAAWSLGLNWWLNRNFRLLTSFSRTVFEGGGHVDPLVPASVSPPATVSAQSENAFFTRLQLAF